jgi:hypothetical protein
VLYDSRDYVVLYVRTVQHAYVQERRAHRRRTKSDRLALSCKTFGFSLLLRSYYFNGLIAGAVKRKAATSDIHTHTTTRIMATRGIMDEEGLVEEEPWWKAWATRILVAAVIVVAFEFIGQQQLPERFSQSAAAKKEEKGQQGEFAPLQYSDLGAEGDDSPVEEDKGATVTTDQEESGIGNPQEDDDDEEDENYRDEDQMQDENIEPVDPPAESSTTMTTSTDADADATTEIDTDGGTKKIVFKNKSSAHPGMTGFHRWYDVETSLYRQLQVGRTDGVDVIPPYMPQSRRGTVQVALRISNELTECGNRDQVINVYWINYKGQEDFKGSIRRGQTWLQTTWIEHPWVFRLSDTNDLLLHYVPDRVIPHLDEAPTISDDDPTVGTHAFTFRPPTAQAEREHFICSIDFPVMPHPASHHFHNPDQAHTWTLLHMKRQEYFTYHPGANLLTKYLSNIAMHPDKPSYRHIRISNRNFYQGIWQTAARGLLLAAGFVEQNAYAEMGMNTTLPSNRVQDVSLVLFRLEQFKTKLEQEVPFSTQQPEGADGSGRAGFGRAGQMNFRK